jgi:hypothetical protein
VTLGRDPRIAAASVRRLAALTALFLFGAALMLLAWSGTDAQQASPGAPQDGLMAAAQAAAPHSEAAAPARTQAPPPDGSAPAGTAVLLGGAAAVVGLFSWGYRSPYGDPPRPATRRTNAPNQLVRLTLITR